MDEKYYTNGLTAEEAEKLQKDYAKIERPVYGVNDRDNLALQFSLSYASGAGTSWQLTDAKDVKALLTGTKAYEVSKLEGKIIEAFTDGNMLRGLSVNENLI
jgi:hypothetical protein